MSVPNQDIVKVGVRPAWNENNKFCRTHLDALQDAMCNLKGETLKLWLYLNKNQDNYQLELSQKACEAWGLKKDAYYTAKKKLIELGYLTPISEGSNIYIFSEKPKEENGLSEKPKNFSEIPKTFSEIPKDFSEKPQRNTTNTTYIQHNTTIGVDEESLASLELSSSTLEPAPDGSLENPFIIKNKDWFVDRYNYIVTVSSGLYRYGSKFYKLEENTK